VTVLEAGVSPTRSKPISETSTHNTRSSPRTDHGFPQLPGRLTVLHGKIGPS
jgi:hypothetical protein